MISSGQPLFLDTSVLIKLFTGTPGQQSALLTRTAAASETLVGSVVRCEFRRRFLMSLDFLVELAGQVSSLLDLEEQIFLRLKHDQRLREMCIDIWFNFVRRKEQAHGSIYDIEELELTLETLRELAWETVRQQIKPRGLRGVRCEGGDERLLDEPDLDVPPGNCKHLSQHFGIECGIANSMRNHKKDGTLKKLMDGIQTTVFQQTTELKRALDVIPKLIKKPHLAADELPCEKHGDLAIALESVGANFVYTVNVRESRVYCSVLGQNLVILRMQKDEEIELEASSDAEEWKRELRRRNS